MTKLPTESWMIKDRPDLPSYILVQQCSIPGCSRTDIENHHIFRRSFGTKSYWVELEDGTVVANRVGVCPTHHLALTTNKAQIVLQKNLLTQNEEYWFIDDFGLNDRLDPHPPFFNFSPQISEAKPQPGEKCRVCERRIPYPKKESSPQTKVFGVRIPVGDVDTFHETLEAAAVHLDLLGKPHWSYWTLLHGIILVLQEPDASH